MFRATCVFRLLMTTTILNMNPPLLLLSPAFLTELITRNIRPTQVRKLKYKNNILSYL